MSTDETKTLTLRKPIMIGSADKGITYDHLDLREPTAGELSKALKAGSNVDVAITLISLIAKVPRSVVEGLCQRDFEEASDFLSSFASDGQATGETSSLS